MRRALLLAVALTLAWVPPSGALSGLEPSGEEAFQTVIDYSSLPGHPRTGTLGGKRAASWLRSELRASGLDVTVERFSFPQFLPRQVSLEVGGFRPAVEPFYYSGSTHPAGITAELVDVGFGTPLDFARSDVAGKIALVDVPTVQNAFTPTWERALTTARDRGAVAVVASIRGPENHIVAQNSDARAGLCNLPTLVVGKADGEELRRRNGQTATLTLHASYTDGRADNLVVTIPGRSDDVLLVGTPYNGWFTSAAERGTGIGVFLSLVRGYARATEPPPQTIMFVAVAGHELGFLGLDSFVRAHPELLGRLTAYVHVGATIAAKQYVEVAGEVRETGLPEPLRVLFTSENPLMLAITESSLRTERSGPMFSMAPRIQNPGEQRLLYERGIPVTAIAGGHLYFHTPGDLPHTTSAELLDPMVAAFHKLVEGLAAVDRETLHAANAPARLLGANQSDENPVIHSCA